MKALSVRLIVGLISLTFSLPAFASEVPPAMDLLVSVCTPDQPDKNYLSVEVFMNARVRSKGTVVFSTNHVVPAEFSPKMAFPAFLKTDGEILVITARSRDHAKQVSISSGVYRTQSQNLFGGYWDAMWTCKTNFKYFEN